MSDFWKKVKSGTKDLADKTGEALETGKLKREIANLKKKNDKLCKKIGEMTVERYVRGNRSLSLSEGEVFKLIKEIQVYKQTIYTLEEKLKDSL